MNSKVENIQEINNDCVAPDFRVPDELWEIIVPLLPEEPEKPKGGRPRESDRKMMDAIFYVLKTGCQWKALPRCMGAPSTVHDRFQEWREAGVFKKMWQKGLDIYDEVTGIDWEWQSMDGVMTKAPLGGEATGPNPTDRGKLGVKRSILTDGNGIPISVTVDKANRHDMKLAIPTLDEIVTDRPDPDEQEQNISLDKGYDFDEVRSGADERGYIGHIRSRGEEKQMKEEIPGYRARRWVVERTHSWMNRFRRLLVRWEKKSENYIAMIHFACFFIVLNSIKVFG